MRTRIEPEAGPGPGGDSRLTPGPAAGEGTRDSRSCGCRVLGVVATGGSRVHWAPERAPVGLGRARSEATSEGPEGAPATEGEGAPATEACRLCRPSSPERSEGGRSPVRRTDDATPPYALSISKQCVGGFSRRPLRQGHVSRRNQVQRGVRGDARLVHHTPDSAMKQCPFSPGIRGFQLQHVHAPVDVVLKRAGFGLRDQAAPAD